VVRDLPDDRIQNGIDHQNDGDGLAHEARRHPHHLVVEQKQERREPAILDAERNRAGGIE
jgi:hypothetical protein